MALSFGSSYKLIASSRHIIFNSNKVTAIRNSWSVVLSQPICLSCFHSRMSLFMEPPNQQKSRNLLSPLPCSILNNFQRRNKSTKKKNQSVKYETESDSDEEQISNITGSKIVKAQSDSLRSDAVVRHGLGLSRNKFDILFYESRMRINGAKLKKRNQEMNIGDEIDIVKDFSEENPKLIAVSRIEVLNARPSGDYILLTLRRTKTMLIENYETDPWEKVTTADEKDLG